MSMALPSSEDYRHWITTPEQLSAAGASFVVHIGHSRHLELVTNLTQSLGLGMNQSGLAAATDAIGRGSPFAYLTLTNDHQPQTEAKHDRVLAWERKQQFWPARGATLIGPPGRFISDAGRKIQFCKLSEQLASETRNPWNRFGLPCAIGSQLQYQQLLSDPPPLVKDPAFQKLDTSRAPHWFARSIGNGAVQAAGNNMVLLKHTEALRWRDGKSWGNGSKVSLTKYLDPPLLLHGVHLGTAVRARIELRVFGLVQWEPLRVWTSRYGFLRAGTPWFNYSSEGVGDPTKGGMWNIHRLTREPCLSKVPTDPPPWLADAEFLPWYRSCQKASRHGGDANLPSAAKSTCCVCQAVSDVMDSNHEESGFSTTGTLRKLEQVATAAGLDPRQLVHNLDGTLIRQMVADQRNFQAQARGAALSRWETPFVADVSFSVDGRAYLYENQLTGPAWKRPGFWWTEEDDRQSAIGGYSSQALAMASLLMSDEADQAHREVLSGKELSQAEHETALSFLRTQGLASILGFRRTWPRVEPLHELSDVPMDQRDRAFAAMITEHRLLLSGPGEPLNSNAPSDVFGGPSADKQRRPTPKPWSIGNGVWFKAPVKFHGAKELGSIRPCADTERILRDYDRHARDK